MSVFVIVSKRKVSQRGLGSHRPHGTRAGLNLNYWNCVFRARNTKICRSQWPRGIRRRSAAARLLGLWFRIPPAAWKFVVSVVWCQVEVSATSWSLFQRSPTDCGASLCYLEHLKNEEVMASVGPQRHRKKEKTEIQHRVLTKCNMLLRNEFM